MNGKAVRRGMRVLALALLTACGLLEGFHLSASNLQVGPNPAVPGDEVMASVYVDITPIERHTIILTINDTEHLRVTSAQEPTRPLVLTLGDAADLIAEYGTGTHSARVEVVAEEKGRSARTQSYSFELRSAP